MLFYRLNGLILFIVFIAFIVIINLLFGKKYAQYAKNKAGESGEKSLAFWLKGPIKRSNGAVMRNVVLPLYDKTTEIDLLVVTSQGVVVLENKHYSGWIKGNVEDRYWIQQKDLITKREFYNPIMQNEGHIKCLNYHLKKNNLHNVNIENLVTFSCGNGHVKVKDPRIKSILGARLWFQREFFTRNHNTQSVAIMEAVKKVAISYKEV